MMYNEENINFGFNTQYSEFCENKSRRHYTPVGFKPMTLATLEQCLIN